MGFGAMNVTKPYKFIGFVAMDVTIQIYKFIGSGDVYLTSLGFSFFLLGPALEFDLLGQTSIQAKPGQSLSGDP